MADKHVRRGRPSKKRKRCIHCNKLRPLWADKFCSRACKKAHIYGPRAERMFKLYVQGMSLKEIGDREGLTRQAVHISLLRNGYLPLSKKDLFARTERIFQQDCRKAS